MEALRQAIQRALEEGNLISDEELKDLLDGPPEQMDAKMKELIDQLIDRLMQEGYVTGQPQVTAPPESPVPARRRGAAGRCCAATMPRSPPRRRRAS